MFTNKRTLKIIVVSLILLIFLLIVYLVGIKPIYETENIFEFVKKEYDSNSIFSSNKSQPIIGGWKTVSNNSTDSGLILTKFDLLKPVYSVVIDNPSTEYFGNIAYQEVDVIYTERIGINEFKIIDYRSSRVDGLDFNQTKDLVSKHDISTDFEGKKDYKITNYSPLSPSEIEANRQRTEEGKKSEDEAKKRQEMFDNETPEEKDRRYCDVYKRFQQQISDYNNGKSEFNEFEINARIEESEILKQGCINLGEEI